MGFFKKAESHHSNKSNRAMQEAQVIDAGHSEHLVSFHRVLWFSAP